MSDESNFIIRILLEAKDNASAEIRRLTAEVAALRAAASGSSRSPLARDLDDVAASAERARGHVSDVRSETERVHSSRSGTPRVARDLDDAAASAERLKAREQELIKAGDDLRRKQAEVSRAFADGRKSVDDVIFGLQRVQQEATRLARQTDIGERVGEGLNKLAQEARRLIEPIQLSRREMEQHERTMASQARTAEDLARSIDDTERSYQRFHARVQAGNADADEARRGYMALSRELAAAARQFSAGSTEAERFGKLAEEARGRGLGIQVDQDAIRKAERLAHSINEVEVAYRRYESAVHAGQRTESDARRGLADFAGELAGIGRSFRAGSAEAEHFLGLADRASRQSRNAASEIAGSWGSIFSDADIGRFFQKLSAATDDWGIKIVSLSAQLRALILVGIVGFAQQLDSAIVALGGSLVSLASAAAMAGAAIGGALVAGIAQAIPVATVLAATIGRIQSVFKASSLAQQISQQKAADPTKAAQQQEQAAQQVQSAQDSLANSYTSLAEAQERVRTSQVELTTARRDAARQIQDLTLAEKAAKLASEGADISLVDAKRALQLAIQRGDTAGLASAQLQVQQAQLGVQRASIDEPRAVSDAQRAQQLGVEGNASVVAARASVRQANQAVVRSRQEIARAQAQLRIAQQRQANPSLGDTAAHSQLNYLLGQMSAPEKQLYAALNRIKSDFQNPNGPLRGVSDAIVSPIADAMKRVDAIFHNNQAIGALRGLANAMGSALRRVDDTLLGSRSVSFFSEMAHQAQLNTPIIASSFEHVVNLFEDVAKAASPILHDFLVQFNNFLDAIDRKASSKKGLEDLEDFFRKAERYAESFIHLGVELGKLFGAIISDAAPSGKQTVDDMSSSIQRMTEWVQSHGPEVRDFFNQTRQAIELLAGMVGHLGLEMIRVFNLSSLRAFTTFIDDILLPALRNFVNVVGFLTRIVLDFFNIFPGGTTALQLFATGVVAVLAIGKLYGPVMMVTNAVKSLWTAFLVFREGGTIAQAFSALVGRMRELQTATRGAATATEELSAAERLSGTGPVVATGGTRKSSGGVILPGGAAAAEEEMVAAEGAIGGGLLSRFGGRAGGLLSTGARALGPAIAVYFGSQLAQSLIGGSAGSKIGSLGKGAAIGAAAGSIIPGIGTAGGAVIGAGASEFKSLIGGDTLGFQPAQVKTSLSMLRSALADENIKKARELASSIRLATTEMDPKKAAPIIAYLDRVDRALKSSAARVDVWSEKFGPAAKGVADSFRQISDAAGSILDQVSAIVELNIKKIARDLGLHSKEGKDALTVNFGQAVNEIDAAMKQGTVSTSKGMQEIRKLVSAALKSYGIKESDLVKYLEGTGGYGAAIDAGLVAGPPVPHHASGAFERAQPGGKLVRVVEGGHDEVILTTDPSKAPRQRALLSEYLRRAPHVVEGFADGGFVSNTGASAYGGVIPPLASLISQLDSMGFHHGSTTGGTHAKDSYHYRGEAVDYGDASNNMGRLWSIVYPLRRRFVELFGPRYLTPKPTLMHSGVGFSDPGLQEEHEDHIHIGLTGAVRAAVASVARAIKKIKAPKINADNNAGVVAQAAILSVTRAANAYLRKVVGTLAPPTTVASSGGGAGALGSARGVNLGGAYSASAWKGPSTITRDQAIHLIHVAEDKLGLSDKGRWTNMLLRQISRESSFRVNPPPLPASQDINTAHGDPSLGLLQLISENFKQYALAPYNKNILDPQSNILAAIRYMIGTYGHGNAEQALNTMIARGGGAYAGGGEIGTGFGGGDRVHILAEEGEHMWTKEEVRNAGGHGAMRALRALFGGGKQALGSMFASGGAITFDSTGSGGRGDNPRTIPFRRNQTAPQTSTREWDTRAIEENSALSKVFKSVSEGFKKLGKINTSSRNFLQNFSKYVNSITDEDTGVLAKLDIAFQQLVSKLQDAATRAVYRTTTLREASGKRITAIRQVRSPLEQAYINLSDDNAERENIRGQQGVVDKSLAAVKSRIDKARKIRDPKKRQKALQTLMAEYNKLMLTKNKLDDEMAQNIQNSYQDSLAVVQAELGEISNRFGTLGANFQTYQAKQQGLGNLGAMPAIDRELAAMARNQIDELQKPLADAKRLGDRDTVAQIEQQIAGLQQTIDQAVVQEIQDRIAIINDKFARKGAELQTWQTRAQAFGNLEELPTIDKLIAIQAQQQISELQGPLEDARRQGNQAAVTQIEQQIQGLQQTITQMVAQEINDRIAAVERTASMAANKASRDQRIGAVQAAEGNAVLGAQTNRFGLEVQRASITQQMAELQPILQQAMAAGDTGAVITLQEKLADLGVQLMENTQALKDNATAIRQAAIEAITRRGQFQGSVFGGLSQIVQTMGQISGQQDSRALIEIALRAGASLRQTNSGLAEQLQALGGAYGQRINLRGLTGTGLVSAIESLDLNGIESRMTEADRKQFEELINSIINNDGAIQQNTLQLNQLNGQLAQFSITTTAFERFRQSIFTGSGGLLPQYQLPAIIETPPAAQIIAEGHEPASGGGENGRYRGIPIIAQPGEGRERSIFGPPVSAPGYDVPYTNVETGDSHYHMHIENPTEVYDPEYAARRFAFEFASQR